MSSPQRPPAPRTKPLSAAQRASEANRAQQLALKGQGARPNDRRAVQPGERSDQGMDDNHNPVGIARK